MAKELLLSGKYSIAEVAHRLGFADQSHLTRHFKQAFGMTPKALQTGRYSEQHSSELQESPTEQLA
jgi:AraC-like DNA-binding protein